MKSLGVQLKSRKSLSSPKEGRTEDGCLKMHLSGLQLDHSLREPSSSDEYPSEINPHFP